ncbi:MAG TPA: amidohydrolase family protein [Acidimicrobiales bacterium]|nr:amidohydrolase family protein [Acidimicrobiales bacterium]
MGESPLDLSHVEILDNHCHGLAIEQMLASDPSSLEARLTITGQAYLTSDGHDAATWAAIEALVPDNVYSMVVRRWLGAYLGCPGEAQALVAARDGQLRADPSGYTRRLIADAGITGLVADEGYTHMPVGSGELQPIVGVPVYRVARIESFIDLLQRRADLRDLDSFAGALEDELEAAASDPNTIALKSIIAYRTGIDITEPSWADASAAFLEWRRAGWAESRTCSKLVRDHLLHRAMRVVERHDIALHIHCGDGDADVVFQHSRPQDLYEFASRHRRQPIVLMHAGHPWSEEAAYMASILPHVYIDLSVLIPWASMTIPDHLTRLLGMMPSRKLLYSSDQVYEPELFWIPARFARAALTQSLMQAVERDYLTVGQAHDVGRGVLGLNSARLHGLAWPAGS